MLRKSRLAEIDANRHRRMPELLQGAQHWLAAAHLMTEEGRRGLPVGRAVRLMESVERPSREYEELEDVRRQVAGGRQRLNLKELSPLTVVRLMTPASTKKRLRHFAHHLLAWLDPTNLSVAWDHAPDVFFRRLPRLTTEARGYFARWLDRRPDPREPVRKSERARRRRGRS